MTTIDEIKAITDQYDDCKVDCSGMVNILHYFLTEANIEHRIYEGFIADNLNERCMPFHKWIIIKTTVGPVIVDYRARMWLGEKEEIPHGVFLPRDFPHVEYRGNRVILPVHSKVIIDALIDKTDYTPLLLKPPM